MQRTFKSKIGDPSSGAALVEFALILPVLLIILSGIIDFGLYLYNDLQLTHVARDAARYVIVGDEENAASTIDNAVLVSATITDRSVVPGAASGEAARVTLTATYQTLTPLPGLVGLDSALPINATAIMRQE